MRLVDTPTFRPWLGVDGSQKGPFVDTGFTHPVAGRLYLPRRVVRDAARADGSFVETVEHEMVLERLAEVEKLLAEAEGELAELRPVRDAIASASMQFDASAA